MDIADLIRSITTLFSEAYAGPANPSSTWFIDNEPDSGILGLISKVSAAEASWSAHHDDPGTTITSHVEHLRWSLANANDAIEGKQYQGNWKESWNTLHADEAKWEQLKKDLHSEFERLLNNLQKQTELPGDYLTGVMALLPHAAYHLGTIRQLIERAQKDISMPLKAER
ncbi:MAG: hypothetical protein ACM3H7_05355 [Acidobacteriaceae bacterium]